MEFATNACGAAINEKRGEITYDTVLSAGIAKNMRLSGFARGHVCPEIKSQLIFLPFSLGKDLARRDSSSVPFPFVPSVKRRDLRCI